MTAAEMTPTAPNHAYIGYIYESVKDWVMHSTAARVTGAVLLAGSVGIGLDLSGSSVSVHGAAPAAASNGMSYAPVGTEQASGCEAVDPDAVETTPPSLFGQMYKQNGSGNQTPFSADKAADQVLGQVCEKELPRAVMSTVYQLYEGQVQTTGDLKSEIDGSIVSDTSSSAITQEQDILNFANILDPTTKDDPFIVDNHTMEIVTTKTGYAIENASLTYGYADGYRIGINNQTNNPEVQKRYQILGNKILITSDGTVLLNMDVASATVNLEQLLQASISKNNPNASNSTQTTANGSHTYTGIGPHGKTQETLPGVSPEATTGPGTTPNTGTPETTPGTGPTSTTPSTYETTTTYPTTSTSESTTSTTEEESTTSTTGEESTTTSTTENYCETHPTAPGCKDPDPTSTTLPQY